MAILNSIKKLLGMCVHEYGDVKWTERNCRAMYHQECEFCGDTKFSGWMDNHDFGKWADQQVDYHNGFGTYVGSKTVQERECKKCGLRERRAYVTQEE